MNEEGVSELEVISVELRSRENKDWRIRKQKEYQRTVEQLQRWNTGIMSLPEGVKKSAEVLETIVIENFPKLISDTKL